MFELLLFTVDPGVAQESVAAGIHGLVIDWETDGKLARQSSADTQINQNTVEDLRRIRTVTDGLVLCRINSFGAHTHDEVEEAIAAGADELLLPMVRRIDEVEAVLSQVDDRCGVGILVETVDAVSASAELGRLPLSRVYIGLNDLAIERGSKSIFSAVADGTVEAVRRCFSVPFGFAGATLPDRGEPIPCRLLIAELGRLDCSWTFLRRSYLRDIKGHDPAVEVPRIQAAVEAARVRSGDSAWREHQELLAAIKRVEDHAVVDQG